MRHRLWVIASALAATAAVGYAQMDGYAPSTLSRSETGRAFLQVLSLLDQHYLTEVDREKVLRGAIQGALGSLEDEFTYYEEPQDNQTDAENLSGEFYGIGVTLEAPERGSKGARVGNVYRGGAAGDAGVKMGDVFVKVDGEDVTGMDLDDIVRLVRGPKGSNVEITFDRDGKPYTVKMGRRAVPNVSVQTTMLQGNVGYIALVSFYNEKAAEQFRAAVADMKAKGVNKLILDLRDNGGGLLNAGVDVADQFLSTGPIVSLSDRSGKEALYGRATDRKTDYTGQLVLLLNSNSASASEVVAGALQDQKRATIIGEKSFGKGVAQMPYDLADGGSVRIVSSEWITPAGRHINKDGIHPDIAVKDTRYQAPLSFMGVGAKPGTEVVLTVDGQQLRAVANEDGQFEYVGEFDRPDRSDVLGVATVELDRDAQLRAALQYLGSGKVDPALVMTPEQLEADSHTGSAHQDDALKPSSAPTTETPKADITAPQTPAPVPARP
ncbi:S41 family peptidase [Deinococcus lacus]|uniref:S41 family peptidase n=1 Tax=Deinococcus lacus TaxID=392561 RepID=A0ABW1Y905_9DEIO